MTIRQLPERGYRILLEGLSADQEDPRMDGVTLSVGVGMNIAGEALLI
jgi:hypothetical protein